MKNVKIIVKQLIAASIVFDLQVLTAAGVVRVQQWRGHHIKLTYASDDSEHVFGISEWLAEVEESAPC